MPTPARALVCVAVAGGAVVNVRRALDGHVKDGDACIGAKKGKEEREEKSEKGKRERLVRVVLWPGPVAPVHLPGSHTGG